MTLMIETLLLYMLYMLLELSVSVAVCNTEYLRLSGNPKIINSISISCRCEKNSVISINVLNSLVGFWSPKSKELILLKFTYIS